MKSVFVTFLFKVLLAGLSSMSQVLDIIKLPPPQKNRRDAPHGSFSEPHVKQVILTQTVGYPAK
jgi:hypothetical protein